MKLPTYVTLLRIGLIPVFVVAFYLPGRWAGIAAAAIFALAALTDWLDGFLARRLGLISAFGAFLDPVADKLMVVVALVLLVEADPRPWIAMPAAVIIGREIAISALREWMAHLGQRRRVAVVMLGKVKTAAQFVAILLMIFREPLWGLSTYQLGVALLYAATALTLWSMVNYLRAALPLIGQQAGAPGEPGRGAAEPRDSPGPPASRSASGRAREEASD